MSSGGIETRGQAQARELIRHLGSKRGHVSQETWDRIISWDQDAHKEIYSAVVGLMELLEPTICTLAKNLYTSNAQFVFELLQNAEDNHYTRARLQGQVPYVAFKMYADRIVIECNEDGFAEDNIRAICAVGQSSKTGAQGYVGEKGIGFKSVFMAAWKVHIQSGDYSFYFQHRRDDSGIGMIRPIWQDPTEDLPPNLTRMTLLLHEDGDPEYLSTQRETIRRQLRDLKGDILLFMRNLQEIRVSFFDEVHGSETTTIFSAAETGPNRVTVTKRVTGDWAKTKSTASVYHVTKYRAWNLAKNENRTYSKVEEETKAYSTADVVLAFPLTPDSVPIMQPQNVFAFLPFLIQSDFVTQASRQDIVTTSARNIGLLDGISDAFIQAMLQFCEHPKLQYTWMRFVPLADHYPFDSFWSRLVTKIREKVQTTPLVRPRSEGSLRLIKELQQPTAKYFDRHGDLLLRDWTPEVCTSRHYGDGDIGILRILGMENSFLQWFFLMVREDLASSDSKMKDGATDDDWHTRVAKLLIEHIQVLSPIMMPRFRTRLYTKLAVLPLQDGSWVAQDSGQQIYFAETQGLEIPPDLQFSLVKSSAAANPHRRELFRLLGVQHLDIDSVRARIFERHRFYASDQRGLLVATFVDQLRFLYLTDSHAYPPSTDYSHIMVVRDTTTTSRPCVDDIYLPDNNPYGPRELLREIKPEEEPNRAAPGLRVDFVHPLYLQDEPQKPRQDSMTWRDWLVYSVRLRRLLKLTNHHPYAPDLSEACYYVSQHRPEKFLGFLSHHWHEGRLAIMLFPLLREKLRSLMVLCQGGQMFPLSDIYLPLPDLQAQCSRFLRGNENFPFLQLEESIERSTYTDPWGPVANCLGLGVEDDLDFYLKILQTVARAEAEEVEDVPRIFELYNVIYGKYLQSADKSVFKKKIRSLFDTTFMIYAPYDNEGPAWIVPKFCLWEGPKIMKTKFVLEWQFEKAIAEGTTELIGLSPFFTEVLEIPDCNCFHIIEEFRDLRDDPDEEIASRVGDLYTRLNDMVGELSIADQERIKQNFSDENLIYAKSGSGSNWHKPSDCIWSSETDLNGTVTLTEHYEDLKGFFVDFVGVKTLTMDMVYQELIRLGSSPEATVKLVKSNLWVLNSFISTSDRLPDTKQLLRRKVFPVRDPGGQVSLQSLATDFIIVDRTHLGDIFRPRVRALDFPFDEVRRLAPTLGWLGMETRYLSRMVKEHSRVDGAGRNPLSSPQRRITPKAYALYRIAYHFNSPRLQAGGDVFETLKTAHVYETDGIASTLCISQDGREFSHEQSRSDLHIEDRDDKLEIFVPRAKKSQELCYARRLPLQLFEWLMTHPTTRIVDKLDEKGLRITQSVLNTSRSLLPDILEGEGIALADLEDDYSGGDDGSDSEVDRATDDDELETPTLVDTEPDVETSAWSTPASSQFPSSPNRGTPPARMASSDRFGGAASAPRASASQRPTQNIPSGSHVHRDTSYTHATSRLGASSRSTTSRPAPVSPSPVDYETRQYRDLLNRVVRAARAAAFPSRGSFDMAGMSEALPILDDYNYHDGLDQYPRFRSSSQLERDKKIGAAGELYVFELLKNLAPALPGFSLENWRSTIRKYVSVHADYAHIEAWNGRETADLVYNDSDGILTELLIENGYLDEEAWRSRMPNYLLEVKATTGPCNTPFYMSKHQYQRMHDHRDDADTIYVIFRVFDVNNSVQLRVYVNPPELEDLGQLVFTAETWSVTPGIPR
ncbi:hypothetical protein ACJZ2D_002554 [Fusarium nematophilum]